MKIAICDDDKILLSKLKDKIYVYSNLHNWESVIDTYENGVELINSNTKYDIIILDYQMTNLNGLETAKKLRNGVNQLSCIIFLTSFPEIAISAYEVDTYRFVVKNTLFNGLYKALDDFRNIKKLDYNITIKFNKETLTINTQDIIFIEVQNKYCYLKLSNNQTIMTKGSLSDLYKILPHTHFFKIHKAYVINFKYITESGHNYLKTKNYALKLPISRNYISQFNKAYYKYIKDNQS